jgi:hypothetical protein
MIRFEHDGFQISCWKTCLKGYDDVNTLKWNLEVEPFVAPWVVQREENMHVLGVGEDHKPS